MNPALAAPRGPGLSGTALKRLACLSMLLDHIGASLLENGLFRCRAIDPRLVGLDQLLRLVGRLAFPIYCFLLVEGFLHTHDFKKYALRMLGFALISEWPFDWAFFSGVYWGHQNVYFTLLLGLLAMKLWIHTRRREGMPALKGILGAAACFLAAALLHCDYDVLGLALILALYMTREGQKSAVHRGRSVLPLRAGGTAGIRAGLVLQRRAGRQLQTRAVGVLLVLPGPHFRPRCFSKPCAFR